MWKKVILIGLGVVVIAAVVFAITRDGAADVQDGITTVEIKKGTIEDKALAVGQIEPRKQIAVKSKIGGLVRRVFVDIGDRVEVGDPLFDIAPDPTPLEYTEAKRQVELAEVSFQNAQREYDRAKSLVDKKLISVQEFESEQARFDEADLRCKLAREKLSLIESGRTNVADREVDNIIKSNIKGTVLTLEAEEGDPVVPLTTYQSGTELMTLAYMDDLIFTGNVDEIDVGKLRTGMDVILEIGAIPNEKIDGRLTRISPKAHVEDGATLFEVEVEITDAGNKFLRAGYSANASIYIMKREDVIVAPERLLNITDTLITCEVQDTAGAISDREVEIGLSDGINVEVVSGLSEGELLVERPPREITAEG